MRARRLTARPDARKRTDFDHPALDGEGEHPPRHGECAVGNNIRAAIADSIKQQHDVTPRDGVDAQIADDRQHIMAEQPLILAPRSLVRLGVPLDVFPGEDGDARQPPLCRGLASLFGSRIVPVADDGVPRERLCARVCEPDLAGVAEGADARLGSELVAHDPALLAAGEDAQIEPRRPVILDVTEVQRAFVAQLLDRLRCELHVQ